MRESWLLLGTSGCHLCDQAEMKLAALGLSGQVQVIDIADENQWQALYGARIPVLLNPDKSIELAWPFSEREIEAVMNQANDNQ